MDNLFSFHKICKQNKISAIKLAATNFIADFLFCLKYFVHINTKSAIKTSGRPFYLEFLIFILYVVGVVAGVCIIVNVNILKNLLLYEPYLWNAIADKILSFKNEYYKCCKLCTFF